MSFADYGFDIFPYSIQDHGCGGKTHYAKRVHDSNVPFDLKELDNLGNLCYNVIDHLVDLGINTENELLLAKQELQRYKTLQRNGLHEAVFQNVIIFLSYSTIMIIFFIFFIIIIDRSIDD